MLWLFLRHVLEGDFPNHAVLVLDENDGVPVLRGYLARNIVVLQIRKESVKNVLKHSKPSLFYIDFP